MYVVQTDATQLVPQFGHTTITLDRIGSTSFILQKSPANGCSLTTRDVLQICTDMSLCGYLTECGKLAFSARFVFPDLGN